jgi:hypothetical protein
VSRRHPVGERARIRIRRTELAPCPACSQPQPARIDGPCATCIATEINQAVRTPNPRAKPVSGMPRLKGPGLRVLTFSGTEKYRVDQRTATNKARTTIRDGSRREWAGPDT